MSKGQQRFEYYLSKFGEQLTAAKAQENPAEYLFTSGSRNILFMLEALSKLYSGLHNKKKFSKLKDRFKELEDTLGAIDYYAAFAKEFSLAPHVLSPITEFIIARKSECEKKLNELLKSEDWLKEGKKNRLFKIREKLAEADWLNEKDETKAIYKYYEVEIDEIKSFIKQTGLPFKKLEEEVHELRRLLRWLSIYPQALQGVVQFTNTEHTDERLSKYMTDEIVNSPFNVLPQPGEHKHFVLLNKKYFLALSWMISELGKLKDSGLSYIALAEGYKATEKLSHQQAMEKAIASVPGANHPVDEVLQKASAITAEFMNEKCLDNILNDVVKSGV